MTDNNDVHIVSGDRAAVRAAWEAEAARRFADQQLRHVRDLAARDGYEEKQSLVRDQVGARLINVLEWLEPYVDGTMGEVTAGLAAVYVRAAGQLAALYNVAGRPRPVTPAPVWPEPEAVEGDDQREALRVEATTAARAAVSGQLAAVRERLQLAAGGDTGQG